MRVMLSLQEQLVGLESKYPSILHHGWVEFNTKDQVWNNFGYLLIANHGQSHKGMKNYDIIS